MNCIVQKAIEASTSECFVVHKRVPLSACCSSEDDSALLLLIPVVGIVILVVVEILI